MKNLIFAQILCLFFLQSCAQSRIAQKAYVYVQHKNFGTIAADRNGKPLTPGAITTLFIYIESNQNTLPKINEIVYNGTVHKDPEVQLAGKNNIDVGNRMIDNKKIILNPTKGYKLWRLEIILENNLNTGETLLPENIKSLPRSDDSINTVIIKGVNNKKPFIITVNSLTELKPFMGL